MFNVSAMLPEGAHLETPTEAEDLLSTKIDVYLILGNCFFVTFIH
jgi:hypothetical protein